MSFMEAVLLGVALSMDSFAVSVTNGMQLDKVTLPYTLAVSLMFGAFQALMPLIGFFCGSFFYAYIEAVDHWIVLALLCALGGKIIFEAVRKWHASYEFKKSRIRTVFAAAAALCTRDGNQYRCACRRYRACRDQRGYKAVRPDNRRNDGSRLLARNVYR